VSLGANLPDASALDRRKKAREFLLRLALNNRTRLTNSTAQRLTRHWSGFRCAPIRSPVVRRAGRNHKRNQLRTIFQSLTHDAVIRVYHERGNVIETHEHAGRFP